MEATYPRRWTWRCPSIESVICPTIMFLKDPEMAMNTRTKTTPMVIRETVRSVLLL
jgi:hypothetical protein